MRSRNTGQIKSVAYSTKKSEIRDGLEIYCVAYKKKKSVAVFFPKSMKKYILVYHFISFEKFMSCTMILTRKVKLS